MGSSPIFSSITVGNLTTQIQSLVVNVASRKQIAVITLDFGVIKSVQYARIAQLGEHLPYKQGVGGSSPSVCTIKTLKSKC